MALGGRRHPDKLQIQPVRHLLPRIRNLFGARVDTRIGHNAQECQQTNSRQTHARRATKLLIEPGLGAPVMG
jgi:hypothetical protein